jgi:pimeloyl-[acyl-carrier protein] methyl ester esterase
MARAVLSCVFVHGWGMNHAVWESLFELLPSWIEPVALDLPGHGLQAQRGFSSLQDLVDDLDRRIEQPAMWIGWSLGGLPVLQLARQQPHKVKALWLVASSPCFVAREDWPIGMQAAVFDSFAAELERDVTTTVKRFLGLQVQGSESGRRLLKTLRHQIEQMPSANHKALRAGLDLLKQTDLRSELTSIRQPTRWVLGERDGLVNKQLIESLAELMPGSSVELVAGAAHAPFLSHREQFARQLIEFAERLK